jgi:hypothetical protein
MRRPVDDIFERVVDDHVRVVDGDGPQVDEGKEAEVGVLVEREEKDEPVVRQGLDIAIDGMKRMGGKGSGDWEG